MRKLILCLVALVAAGMWEMQAQISVGVGISSQGYTMRQGSESHGGAALGLSADFEASFRLYRNFGVSAGAALSGVAGYHFAGSSKNLGEIYLDIPMRAKYYIPLTHLAELYLFGGVVPSACLVTLDAHAKGTTSNYETYPTLTHLDLMLGGGVGLEAVDHLRVTLGYDYGLLDRDTSSSITLHRSNLKLAVYYMF